MCTSIISNRKKTIVGWNLDITGIEYRISKSNKGVYIEVLDEKQGWLPLFGANNRGDFVGMPTCHPFDDRSNPSDNSINVMDLDMDLLLENKTLLEIKNIVENNSISSLDGVTYMGALSDSDGNVLHIIPGQGYKYYEKPTYNVITNFSPFKMKKEVHPWMGYDRYQIANLLLSQANDDFDVDDCFYILKMVSQVICPTVVSMVYDVTEKTVYWCIDRNYDSIESYKL